MNRKLRCTANTRVVCWSVRCICTRVSSTNPDFEEFGKSPPRSTFGRNGVAQSHSDQPTRRSTTQTQPDPLNFSFSNIY